FVELILQRAELHLGLLPVINVRQQHVPVDDVAVGIAKWKATQLEPPVPPVGSPDAMLDVVGLTGFDRVLPGGYYTRDVSRMDGIDGAPLLQFFERPAKVLEDLAVDVLDLTCRRHDRDQAGNGFDDQARLALAFAQSQFSPLALGHVD